MPLYVYSCPDCEIELEELRPSSRVDDPVECPVCHGLCTRDLTTFSMGRSSSSGSASEAQQPARTWAHAAGCSCCMPRR
jgi:putative FmdB family regulatory protein